MKFVFEYVDRNDDQPCVDAEIREIEHTDMRTCSDPSELAEHVRAQWHSDGYDHRVIDAPYPITKVRGGPVLTKWIARTRKLEKWVIELADLDALAVVVSGFESGIHIGHGRDWPGMDFTIAYADRY